MIKYVLFLLLALLIILSPGFGCNTTEKPSVPTEEPQQLYYDLELHWQDGKLALAGSPIRLVKDAPQQESNYVVSVSVDESSGELSLPEPAEIGDKPFHLYIKYIQGGKELSINQTDGESLLAPISLPTNANAYLIWILALVLLLMVAGAVVFFIVRRDRSKRRTIKPSQQPPALQAAVIPKARLLLPGNMEIPISAGITSIGRSDIARTLAAEDLKYVSKHHCKVEFSNGEYYIEDIKSANGTKLNGVEIRGKGRQQLEDDDRVEIANALTVTFKTH